MVLPVWPHWTRHIRQNPRKSNNNFQDYTQRGGDQNNAYLRQNKLFNDLSSDKTYCAVSVTR